MCNALGDDVAESTIGVPAVLALTMSSMLLAYAEVYEEYKIRGEAEVQAYIDAYDSGAVH